MHIFQILTADIAKSGVSITHFCLSISKWLLDRNFKVTLLYRKRPLLKPVVLQDFPNSIFKANDVHRRLSAHNFHIPYSINQAGLLLFGLLALHKFTNINKKQKVSLIHAQDMEVGGIIAILASVIHHVPVIVHCGGKVVTSLDKRISKLKFSIRKLDLILYRGITLIINKVVIKKADRIIAVSEDTKRFLTSIGAKSKKVIVIPNGIDVGKFRTYRDRVKARHLLGINEKAFVFGYVGRLSLEKNVESLVKAAAEIINSKYIPNPLLVIVGDGPEERKLFRLTEKLGIREKTIFTGYREDVHQILPAIDVWALLSFTEGLSSALLEAMATGRPIIASNIPSIKEVIDNGETGLLVDPRNIREISKAILKFYKAPELGQKLGSNASLKVEFYDQEKTIPAILALYKRVAS